MGSALCPCPKQGKYDLDAKEPVSNGQTQDLNKTKPMSKENGISKKEGGEDPAAEGAALEDRYYNNKAFDKPDIDSSDPQQQDAALKIQTKYRQHHAKHIVKEKREEVAAVKIQAGYRGYQDRKRVNNMKSEGQEGEEVTQDVNESAEPDESYREDDQAVAAATTIQAGFKGYKARKEVQELKQPEDQPQEQAQDDDTAKDQSEEGAAKDEEAKPEGEEAGPEGDYETPEANAAATKIQASFKGYLTRKDMDGKDGGEEATTEAPAAGEEGGETAEEKTEQEQAKA